MQEAAQLQQAVRSTFRAFATPSSGVRGAKVVLELDGPKFAKLCRDSRLVGGKLSKTGVDLTFSKVKSQVGAPWRPAAS